ncbi:MAG: hypothetical protein ACO4CS_16130 [bacterium]
MKETQIQKAVLDWLHYKGYFAVRLNNIPTPTASGGFRPVAMKGLPDAHVDVVVEGMPISVWVEFKTEKGRLSPHQKSVMETIGLYGGFYFVIRSIDEMERAIETVTHDVRGRLTAMTISGERNE